MKEDSLFFWSLFNAVLPLVIPFLIVLLILWITERDNIFNNTLDAFADGQLCVLAVTLSLITFYELRSTEDLAMTAWVVMLAVISAIMLGLIYAFNDSTRVTQNVLKTSKKKMAYISIGAAIASVTSAIYCHNSINNIELQKTLNVLEQTHEKPR